MKLSKLYSNFPDIFHPIIFKDGLNAIIGEIKNPKDDTKDTHNLGKTTLISLLNFMFLAKRNKKQFMFKHYDKFEDFKFFLEIKLNKNSFVTIKRSISKNSKVSLVTHSEAEQDFTDLSSEKWKHIDLTIDRAKMCLEGYLSFDVLKKWDYRKLIGFHLRAQKDFDDVFKLSKNQGRDQYWKPYVADLLGLDASLVEESYDKQNEILSIKNEIDLTPVDASNISAELSDINGKILLRNNNLKVLEEFVDNFDFSEADQKYIETLVGELNAQISQKNAIEYSLKNNIVRIEESLNIVEKIKFDTKKVQKLFNEANVLFPDKLVKSFDQLIEFNETITKERRSYLEKDLIELNKELKKTKEYLVKLNQDRTEKISFLVENEIIEKFKKSSLEIIDIKADIGYLELRRTAVEEIQNKQRKKSELEGELKKIQEKTLKNIEEISKNADSIFSKILIYFNEIISTILDKEGSLTVFQNENGNIEFNATYKDKKGENTSEGDGNTYKKLLCIAFDLAISRVYLEKKYIRFIYIDGVFEGLDVRKKRKMLEILKQYSKLGLQIIITSIDTDMRGVVSGEDVFSPDEIILKLNDSGKDGRLFKMDSW